MSSSFYFIVCALIWGSTWHAINFQIDYGNPSYAVAFRFLLASLLLALFIWWRRLPMRFRIPQHLTMCLAGLFLYTLDYSFLYVAQQHIMGAFLAVLSTSVIYFNVILRRVFLRKPIRREVVIGATLGFVGICSIFYPELRQLNSSESLMLGLIWALCSFSSASIGNIISEHLLDDVSVVAFNCYSMFYGSVVILLGLQLFGIPWQWPEEVEFYAALAYLSIFGSVIAFGCYMLLVQRLGSDKAAYVVLVYPVIALFIATVMEGYQWSLLAIFGVACIGLGNFLALSQKNTQEISVEVNV